MSRPPLPTIDEVASDPARAQGLAPEVRQALTLRALAALAALAVTSGTTGPPPAAEDGEDRLLDVDEAAARLGVSSDWLYRRAARLPFTVRLGRTLRFSVRGLDRFIRTRQSR